MIIDNKETFLATLQERLDASSEADFWKSKLPPAAKSILDILLQLKDQNLLFNPEGKEVTALTVDELFRWFDLVSLKTLIFTLDLSNQEGKLVRTKLDETKTAQYKNIDISDLATHLQLYGISLNDENEDFPNRFYVQHYELGEMIKRLMA